tara:strand:- start:257 stop:1330 length:1074 start_codon:yes stop_codon:yes gene_type:complete
MITKIAKNRKQKKQNFYCGTCDYTSSNSFDFNKHKMTRKHKNRIKMTINGNKISSVLKNACEICGKVYKHKSGLSRHKKKCINIKKNVVETSGKSYHLEGNKKSQKKEKVEKKEELEEKIELLEEKLKVADLEKKLLEKDLSHKDQIIDIYKEHGNKPSSVTNNNLDNCFNKNLTVNLYLNEHCKNAMNLEDFVDNIKVQLQDIMYQSEMGAVDGITNIITQKLNDMPATERPIHCTDEKRLQFYVKEEDEWNKKKADDEVLNMRDQIKNKQILAMDEWENENPGFVHDPKLQDEYSKIMGGILEGYEDDKKMNKQIKKVKKKIASACSIKDAMKELNNVKEEEEDEGFGKMEDFMD